MEATSLSSRPREEPEFTLKEWNLKARISRENTMSRRFSGSYIRSFKDEENARSFRSNITISSTASSPGYRLKDEIDPSTYSFTSALKALQARSGYVWECLSPEGFALNSKWSEAERYICNPLSGEFPMECLSSKTLSGRSNLHNLIAGRITMSAPLVYSTNHPSRRILNVPPKPPVAVKEEQEDDEKENHKTHPPIQGKKETGVKCKTRDVGTQSIPPDCSPSSSIITSCSSPASPIHNEAASKCCFEPEDGRDVLGSNLNSTEESVQMEVVKATKDAKEETKRNPIERQIQQQQQHIIDGDNKEKKTKKKTSTTGEQLCRCSSQSGCLLGGLSWRSLWMRKRRREKHKSRSNKLITIISLPSHTPHRQAPTQNPLRSESTTTTTARN